MCNSMKILLLVCVSALLQKIADPEPSNPSWRLSFPHVLVATISSFLFGYHLGLVLTLHFPLSLSHIIFMLKH